MNHSSFTYRPKNAVTAILDQEALDQALSILTEAGVDSTSVEVLSGQEGAEILDLDGSHHGLRARLVRHIQLLGSSENDLRNYSIALQEDRAVVIVPRGLLSRTWRRACFPTSRPSTRTTLDPPTNVLSSPGAPSTVTRRALIRSSAPRRDARPARAR